MERQISGNKEKRKANSLVGKINFDFTFEQRPVILILVGCLADLSLKSKTNAMFQFYE